VFGEKDKRDIDAAREEKILQARAVVITVNLKTTKERDTHHQKLKKINTRCCECSLAIARPSHTSFLRI